MKTSTIEIPTVLKESLTALSKINNDLKAYGVQKNCKHMKEAFDECSDGLGNVALLVSGMIQSASLDDYYHKDETK